MCQSSRLVGTMRHRCVCAWIQYSRRTPPGAGWSCGTACAAAACGRRTRAAVASAFLRAAGESTTTFSPPIVHSSAALPARPKNDRREVGRLSASGVMGARILVRLYSVYKYVCTGYDGAVSTTTGTRAEASERMREAIVAATVRVVAREGVSAVTHRRVAAEAGVSLSSTTWHFADKGDILIAALRWTAGREVARIAAIAERLGTEEFDPAAWAEALADWLLEQVHRERDVAVALYRLQIELLGRPEARQVHEDWDASLRTLGERVLASSGTITPDLDIRLVVAALDGLRLNVLIAGEADTAWLRPAVQRQLRALLG